MPAETGRDLPIETELLLMRGPSGGHEKNCCETWLEVEISGATSKKTLAPAEAAGAAADEDLDLSSEVGVTSARPPTARPPRWNGNHGRVHLRLVGLVGTGNSDLLARARRCCCRGRPQGSPTSQIAVERCTKIFTPGLADSFVGRVIVSAAGNDIHPDR